jgi:hypothetical protein
MATTVRPGSRRDGYASVRVAGLFVAALAILATVAAYLTWLGWHAVKDVHPNGSETGPYEAWQVVGLVLTIAVVTVCVGWSGHRWASFVIPAALTLAWSWDAATVPEAGPSFWPIGAFCIAVGSTITVPTIAFLAAAIASRRASNGRRRAAQL